MLPTRSMRERIIRKIKGLSDEQLSEMILDNKLSYLVIRNEMIKEDFYNLYNSMPTMDIYTELELKYNLSVNSIMMICKGRY